MALMKLHLDRLFSLRLLILEILHGARVESAQTGERTAMQSLVRAANHQLCSSSMSMVIRVLWSKSALLTSLPRSRCRCRGRIVNNKVQPSRLGYRLGRHRRRQYRCRVVYLVEDEQGQDRSLAGDEVRHVSGSGLGVSLM